MNSISAPVFNEKGELVLAVSLMKPGLPADADPAGVTARAARECALRISQKLGYRPEDSTSG